MVRHNDYLAIGCMGLCIRDTNGRENYSNSIDYILIGKYETTLSLKNQCKKIAHILHRSTPKTPITTSYLQIRLHLLLAPRPKLLSYARTALPLRLLPHNKVLPQRMIQATPGYDYAKKERKKKSINHNSVPRESWEFTYDKRRSAKRSRPGKTRHRAQCRRRRWGHGGGATREIGGISELGVVDVWGKG